MPGSKVDILRPADEAAWDAYVLKHPQGSVYHLSWWLRLMEENFGHRNHSLLCRNDDGEIVGGLPLFSLKGVFGRRMVSSPLRDRGGVLASDAQTLKSLLKKAVELTTSIKGSYLCLKQGENNLSEEPGFAPVSHWITNRIALPVDVKGVESSALRNVRKAERAKVVVDVGCDENFARRFHRIFRESRQRLGVPTYSKRFFEELAKHSENAGFLIARLENQDLAGAVLLNSHGTFLYGYAGNAEAGREFRASDLVVWKALQSAQEKGGHTFDFGADSPHQTELRRFKRKWGATETPLTHYYFLTGSHRLPLADTSDSQWSWVRKTLSVVPTTPFEWVSSWMVRQVD